MHVLDPFILDLPLEDGMSVSELNTVIEASFAHQRVVEAFLQGSATLEDLLASAAELGVDGYEYEDYVCRAIEQTIAAQSPILGTEGLLLHP